MSAPRANFDDLAGALTTIFIIVLGEDWPGVMYNYCRVYTSGAGKAFIPFFFLTIFSLGNLMLLSLFTAILLSHFEGGDEDEEKDEEEEEKEIEEEKKKDKLTCSQKWSKFQMNLKVVYYDAFGTAQVIEQVKA